MKYSTTLQRSNTKDLLFWAVRNSQICGSEVVNSTDFETSNICQNLSFFCSLEYKVFCTVVEYIIDYI
jgi:hypothetical protein